MEFAGFSIGIGFGGPSVTLVKACSLADLINVDAEVVFGDMGKSFFIGGIIAPEEVTLVSVYLLFVFTYPGIKNHEYLVVKIKDVENVAFACFEIELTSGPVDLGFVEGCGFADA